jgi:hypothetical protein
MQQRTSASRTGIWRTSDLDDLSRLVEEPEQRKGRRIVVVHV